MTTDPRIGATQVERMRNLQVALDTVLLTATHAERVAAARNLGALAELLRRLAVDSPEPVPDEGAVEAMIAAVHPLAKRYLSATSSAIRRKVLTDLVSEAEVLTPSLGTVLDAPLLRGSEYSLSCYEYARDRALIEAADGIEVQVARVEQTVRAARRAEEERETGYAKLLSVLSASAEERISAAERRFDEESARIGLLSVELQDLLHGALIHQISAGHEAAEKREREAADRWRAYAVSLGLLGALALTVLSFFVAAGLSVEAVATHGSVLLGAGGVAAYCARQAAEHRREQRELRDEQLRLAGAVDWMTFLSAEAKEKFGLHIGLTRFSRSRSGDGRDLNGAAVSPLPPVPQYLESLHQFVGRTPVAGPPEADAESGRSGGGTSRDG